MKFVKSALAAIVACMVLVSSAWSDFGSVENICEVQPDGSINTVRLHHSIGVMYYAYFFKNLANQHTTVFTDSAISSSYKTFSLPPGTYTLSYKPPVGNQPLLIWPHTIVLRPYTLRPGQGTGCVLNVAVTGTGAKDQRVPAPTLPR
jgi:hypothetical protein